MMRELKGWKEPAEALNWCSCSGNPYDEGTESHQRIQNYLTLQNCCSGNPYDEGTERGEFYEELGVSREVAAEIPMMRELKGPWISPFPEFNATSLRTPSASF